MKNENYLITWVLQLSVSVSDPSHPMSPGLPFKHCRVKNRIPPPHVSEHGPSDDQEVQVSQAF